MMTLKEKDFIEIDFIARDKETNKVFDLTDKETAKKDMSVVKDVVDFQLAILSATLPVYRTRKAKELVKFIESCYQINIQEVSKRMHELVDLYFKYFKNKNFNRMFFDCVFYEVCKLLK